MQGVDVESLERPTYERKRFEVVRGERFEYAGGCAIECDRVQVGGEAVAFLRRIFRTGRKPQIETIIPNPSGGVPSFVLRGDDPEEAVSVWERLTNRNGRR